MRTTALVRVTIADEEGVAELVRNALDPYLDGGICEVEEVTAPEAVAAYAGEKKSSAMPTAGRSTPAGSRQGD